jgi:hypothetical protein
MEKVVIKDSTYRLKKAKILQTKRLTANEMLFEVALADGEVLDQRSRSLSVPLPQSAVLLTYASGLWGK